MRNNSSADFLWNYLLKSQSKAYVCIMEWWIIFLFGYILGYLGYWWIFPSITFYFQINNTVVSTGSRTNFWVGLFRSQQYSMLELKGGWSSIRNWTCCSLDVSNLCRTRMCAIYGKILSSINLLVLSLEVPKLKAVISLFWRVSALLLQTLLPLLGFMLICC